MHNISYKSLDTYRQLPEAMQLYLENYGWHFSKKACDFAISQMRKKNPGLESTSPITPWAKEDVERMLQQYNVVLKNNKLYDHVYLANMVKADMYKSSIEDEKHVALYIKDVIDDVDASGESTFRCWLAKLAGNGEPISWEDLL